MIKRVALLLLLLNPCLPAVSADLKTVEDEVAAPALQLEDLSGNHHNLEDYQGQVVLVQFWATYCPPCIKEMPSMNRMQIKLADTPFKILAVNMGETRGEVDAFVLKVKPEFTILMDESGKSIADWRVFGAPANFIIGPGGKVRYTLFGGVEWDDDTLIQTIKALSKH